MKLINILNEIATDQTIYYHGTKGHFDHFDANVAYIENQYNRNGKAVDAEGPGFYFTDNRDFAYTYAGQDGQVIEAYLDIKKPVPFKGRVNVQQVEKLMRAAPDLEMTLTDWDEDPRRAFQKALQAIIVQGQPKETFERVWYDFYRDDTVAWLKGMIALGYDGIIVPQQTGDTHVVMFNPAKIQIIGRETFKESTERRWTHISNNPNLNPSQSHELRQGQMGKGFYVTAGDPQVWRDSLGDRKFTYVVTNANEFNIATKTPSMIELRDWAIKKGYMEIKKVVKPNGQVVLDNDGKPLYRPDVTQEGKAFLWKDPMTGGGIKGLENEYLRDHGYDGIEASYSPDGHQIILFNPSKVKLKKLGKKISESTAKPYTYLTQCDRLRQTYTGGEAAWHTMMAKRKPISQRAFERACDLTGLLDPDETLSEFIAYDPDAGFYQSTLAGHSCALVQHSGFEFIFVKQGEVDMVKAALGAPTQGRLAEDADSIDRAQRMGFTIPAFHGTDALFDEFKPFSHFGTKAQARMRNSSRIIPVLIRGKKFKRMKDTGRGQWDSKKLRALERQGYDGIVYMNRYEGIPLSAYERARERGINTDQEYLDRLSDTQFKKAIPMADDSYIIFDPHNVRHRDAQFVRHYTTNIMENARKQPLYFIITGQGMPAVTFIKSLARNWHKTTIPAIKRIYSEMTGLPPIKRNGFREIISRDPLVHPAPDKVGEAPFDEADWLHFIAKYDAWEIAPDGSYQRVGTKR